MKAFKCDRCGNIHTCPDRVTDDAEGRQYCGDCHRAMNYLIEHNGMCEQDADVMGTGMARVHSYLVEHAGYHVPVHIAAIVYTLLCHDERRLI